MTHPAVQKRGADTARLAQHRVFVRSLPADGLAVRHVLSELCERLAGGFPPDMLGRAELVLAEVMNNIVRHGIGKVIPGDGNGNGNAHPRMIHLSVTGHAGGLACAISDYGTPLPAEVFLTRAFAGDHTTPTQDWPEGGFGWLLIRDLTRALTYFREGDRNLLVFNVPLDENAPQPEPRPCRVLPASPPARA